ncbi:hypothetical protein QD336_17390 [Rhizobium sp. BR 250]
MMAKLQATWRKVDVTRAILAAKAGGLDVSRIEIENGRIVIISASENSSPETELDRWEREHARKA